MGACQAKRDLNDRWEKRSSRNAWKHGIQSVAMVIPQFKERHAGHQEWRAKQLEGVAYPVNSSV